MGCNETGFSPVVLLLSLKNIGSCVHSNDNASSELGQVPSIQAFTHANWL